MKTLKRRKKECKTDYLKRLKLLKSEKPRLVFRKTNRYIIAQYAESEAAQDKVVFGFTSKNLLERGWKGEFAGSLKSIPASYLTGYLCGKKIKKENLEKPIVDLGMQRVIRKSAVFAFLKGLIDAEIEIPCNEENFPDEETLEGKNAKDGLSKMISEIKSKIDKL